MKLFVLFFLFYPFLISAQTNYNKAATFKGEHFALYNRCKGAVTFCELTQQSYTSCGSVKNCYGLYVMPGDTFYINIEDKNQSEYISADISFGGYFAPINSFTFAPIDLNCLPQHALLIAIPLSATIGSSFQVIAQNTANTTDPSQTTGVPPPFNIFVGGQQPQFTFALTDFTDCPALEVVSISENLPGEESQLFFPNPSSGEFHLNAPRFSEFTVQISDAFGNFLLEESIEGHSMDLSILKNGMYLCRFEYGKSVIGYQRLVILK